MFRKASSRETYGAFALVVVLLLAAACTNRSSTMPPTPVQVSSVSQGAETSTITRVAVPRKCSGQKTLATYAVYGAEVRANGGTICIPAFEGFDGTLKYASARWRFTGPKFLKVVSGEPKRYPGFVPGRSGTPIFTLTFSMDGGILFGGTESAGGSLLSGSLAPSKHYTAYVFEDAGYGLRLAGTCGAVATRGRYGGVARIERVLKSWGIGPVIEVKVYVVSGSYSFRKC